MKTSETILKSETKGKFVKIFSHFMERVAKFEELSAAGNRLLVSFRQGLEYIRRPSIDKPSELLEKVIKANYTDRMQSYIKAGYVHTYTRAENLNKLNTSHSQLLDNASKAKDIINELECLVEEAKVALEAASESLQDYNLDLDPEEDAGVSCVPAVPGDVDYAIMLAVVYSMVKQDYVMQEKIVSALNLKTSSGELESYCLMWSLHPFVNDEIVHQAWKLVA
uniref:uncharacterized protein LOC122585283 n=1 Tax=Erigeron canadensis TaxID=72917 RepID=UPI001CB9AFF1|nr:uncharacterized protein LOC122585283 [Erigeron canadensis]